MSETGYCVFKSHKCLYICVMTKVKRISNFATHERNPSVVKIRGIQKFGKEVPFKEDVIITRKDTGESYDGEVDSVSGYLEDDARDRLKFTKVYAGTEDELGRLGSGGLRVLMYIIKNMKQDHDEVTVNAEICRDELGYRYRKNVYNGLCELLEAGFIYRKVGLESEYFINVNKIFKGRRTKLLPFGSAQDDRGAH